PIKNQSIEEGEEYNIIISSTEPSMIEKLFFGINQKSLLNLGDASFSINNMFINSKKIYNTDTIETPVFINLTKKINDKIRPVLFNNGLS
ncbi:MAG: hypothetical protein ACQESF_06330, partial [Nanobdellota archaeon]